MPSVVINGVASGASNDDAVHRANRRANRADAIRMTSAIGMVAISGNTLLAFSIDCSNVAATTAAVALPDAPPTGSSPGDDESRHAQRDNNTYRRLRQNIT